jgi:hypothetical protein
MTALLTWDGSVLCRHRRTGEVVRRPLSHSFDDAEPLDIGLPVEALHASFENYLRADDDLSFDIAEGPLQGWHVSRSADRRSIVLTREGQYLSATNGTDTLALAAKAGDWEGFMPISDVDFGVLFSILRTDWLIRPTGQPVAGSDVAMVPFHELNIGPMKVDLRWQMPLDLSQWPNRLTLLRDGWRIVQICRYRPLVYFAAFGDDSIMAQCAIALRSLVDFGGYDGDIAILTDREPSAIGDLLPGFDHARLKLVRCDAQDRSAFMAARYAIADWAEGWNYQPILYVDTDTVFDAPIEPMLRAIALSDRASAPVEQLSPLSSSGPVGAGLLQLDGHDPAFRHGFNSGTIGIPNLAAHGNTLRLIARIIANRATTKGRDALRYVDQEIANYVGYRLSCFDTTLLSPYVRIGGTAPIPTDGRCGLVHFWAVPSGAQRGARMAEYVASVERAVGAIPY